MGSGKMVEARVLRSEQGINCQATACWFLLLDAVRTWRTAKRSSRRNSRRSTKPRIRGARLMVTMETRKRNRTARGGNGKSMHGRGVKNQRDGLVLQGGELVGSITRSRMAVWPNQELSADCADRVRGGEGAWAVGQRAGRWWADKMGIADGLAAAGPTRSRAGGRLPRGEWPRHLLHPLPRLLPRRRVIRAATSCHLHRQRGARGGTPTTTRPGERACCLSPFATRARAILQQRGGSLRCWQRRTSRA